MADSSYLAWQKLFPLFDREPSKLLVVGQSTSWSQLKGSGLGRSPVSASSAHVSVQRSTFNVDTNVTQFLDYERLCASTRHNPDL